jgi:hypothetical protein
MSNPIPKTSTTARRKGAGALLECGLCCETTTKCITCNGCGYNICIDDAKKYLLGSIQIEPHCVSCKQEWTPEFMYASFPASWYDKTYREYEKKIILAREKAMLPMEMLKVPARIKLDKLQQELTAAKSLYLEQRYHLVNLKRNVYIAADNLDLHLRNVNGDNESITQAFSFICPCPHIDLTDNTQCRGMIDNKFKCSVCSKSICPKCRQGLPHRGVSSTEELNPINDPTAVGARKPLCAENDLETVKTIKRDCKPCPKCAVPIHKTEGCSQMFCVQCKTVFDWNTMKMDASVIHNPYAVQWMRANGSLARDPNDVPCGGLIEVYMLARNMALQRHPENIIMLVIAIHRSVAEIDGMLGHTYAPLQNIEYLRHEYIMKRITEDQWVKTVYDRERTNRRRRMTTDILTSYRQLMIPVFREFNDKTTALVAKLSKYTINPIGGGQQARRRPHGPDYTRLQGPFTFNEACGHQDAYDAFYAEASLLRNLCNEGLSGLKHLGSVSHPYINDEFEWTTVGRERKRKGEQPTVFPEDPIEVPVARGGGTNG